MQQWREYKYIYDKDSKLDTRELRCDANVVVIINIVQKYFVPEEPGV